MGLDAVELVMAFEDAFDIRIENSEAEPLVTPGMVIDFIFKKVTVASTATCLTQRAFNLFRRFLLRNSGLKRSDITPSTHLDCLIPRSEQRATLEKFAAEMGIKDRIRFVRPNGLTAILFGASVLIGLSASVLIPVSNGFQSLLIFLCTVVLSGFAGAALTTGLRSEIAGGIETVGDIARWAMSHKSDLAGTSPAGWTRDQIAARVREIVIEELDCEPQYREDARFVEDLGMY